MHSFPDLCASPKTKDLITPELQSQSPAPAMEEAGPHALACSTANNQGRNGGLETGLYWLENSTLVQSKAHTNFST